MAQVVSSSPCASSNDGSTALAHGGASERGGYPRTAPAQLPDPRRWALQLLAVVRGVDLQRARREEAPEDVRDARRGAGLAGGGRSRRPQGLTTRATAQDAAR